MNTILVPVDLTAAAEHTLVYANKLAVRLNAEIVLLYCHHGSELNTADTVAYRQRLASLAERLRYVQLVRQDGRRIRYRYAVHTGCLHDQIQTVIDNYQADLVLMSLEYIDCGEASINGNHAARIAELASCPVLVVPPDTRVLPTRVAFLADFGRLDVSTLAPLTNLVKDLRPQLQLVHFYQRLDLPELIRVKRGMQLIKEQMANLSINTRLVLDDDPLEAIREFCDAIQTQLLVFAPANAELLHRFFDVCYAKTRAYHTRIPVLILPQQPQPAHTFCCQHCAEQQEATQLANIAPEAVLA